VNRQRAWVIALSLIALVIFMPAASDGWKRDGTFGMRIERAEPLIRSVAPGSPAAEAGIEAGDRIDLRLLGEYDHLKLMAPAPGTTLNLSVIHDGVPRDVTLTAVVRKLSQPLRLLILGEFLSTAAFIVVGALLVFLRPAPMTWWLWLYCVGIVPVNELLDFYSFLPAQVYHVVWLVGRILFGGFSAFPLMPFVLRFPEDRISGWRERVRVPAIAFTAVLLAYYISIAWIGLHDGLDHYSLFNGLPALGVYLFSATLLLLTYQRSHGSARQRLKWVVTGMLIGFIAQIIVYLPGPPWQAPLCELLSIAMPISVVYAALRQRLIDVDFVINRAIVYAIMTALLIAFVSLIDFVTSHFISEYHLALYAEAAATIAVGFALDRFRGELDRFTERIFFKARHQAEAQLERVARSLEFVTREESIEEALVDEPVRWLRLASAALFVADEGRATYSRIHSVGWDEGSIEHVPDDASVVRYLKSERGPLDAKDVAWDDPGLPRGAAAPLLYIPIFCREELFGFAIYGAHKDTTTLDPAEVDLLSALGPRAGIAFDHITYVVMREQLADATERASLNEKLLAAWLGRTPAQSGEPAAPE